MANMVIEAKAQDVNFVTKFEANVQHLLNVLGMRAIGASLGSGAVLVIDESRDMIRILQGIAHFFNHESCGKCAPCREGSYRVAEIMDRFAEGKGSHADIEKINNLSDVLGMACFCPLGQSVCVAIKSALELFPEEFEKAMEVK